MRDTIEPEEESRAAAHDAGRGWIGVDFDRTLAVYDKWQGPEHVGEPIWPMVWRVRQWLREGREVRIFTARVWHDDNPTRLLEAGRAAEAIRSFCLLHFGRTLKVTCVKDHRCLELWDDRAVTVEPNTGEVVHPSAVPSPTRRV